MTTQSAPVAAQAPEEHAPGNRLGAFLCWAVVFADIGTSVYYTPGILYGLYGALAGFFVILTLGVFILLTLKYAEVTERFPEGGGVVTVTSHAIGPWAGALGGMLILVDYFLTAALSSLSGVTYISFILPAIGPAILWLTIVAVVALGVLNWWGIKESASVSAVIAVVAFVSDIVVLLMVAIHVPLATITRLFTEMFAGHALTFQTLIAGYAGAFLAFSGLESISQLSPVMRVPRKQVAGWALGFVVVTVGITSPLLTVFSTTLLCAHGQFENGLLTCVSATGKNLDPNQFISLLGSAVGGPGLGIAVAISAAALLIFASNTAIIGSYHVFLALTRMQFFPPVLTHLNRLRGTPHWAILLATGIPILVLLGARGQIGLLGDLYAFGLLGAFTLTCLGIDILRWREARWRGVRGAAYTGPSRAHDEAELAAQNAADARRQPGRSALALTALDLPGRVRPLTAGYAGAVAAARGWSVWPALAADLRPIGSALAPVRRWLRPWWGPLAFVIGGLTTFLVGLAWGVNLVNKPLATEFGGGVTLAGLAVALGYQIYRAQIGEPTIHPLLTPSHYKNAWLVILPPAVDAGAARRTLVQTVAEAAGSHNLIFAYLDPAPRRFDVSSVMEIGDPWAHSQVAQRALSKALVTAWRAGVPRSQLHFYFATGGLAQLTDIWRSFRPDETIAYAGQGVGHLIQVDYMRTQGVNGGRIAFYGHHLVHGGDGHEGAASSETPATSIMRLVERGMVWLRHQRARLREWFIAWRARGPGATPIDTAAGVNETRPTGSAGNDDAAGSPTPSTGTTPARSGIHPIPKVFPANGRSNRPPLSGANSVGSPDAGALAGAKGRDGVGGPAATNGSPGVPPTMPGATPDASAGTNGTNEPAAAGSAQSRTEKAVDPLNLVPPEALAEAEQYVWTGTELRRRDEMEPQPAAALEGTPGAAGGAITPDPAAADDTGKVAVPITPEAAALVDVEPEAVAAPDDAPSSMPADGEPPEPPSVPRPGAPTRSRDGQGDR